MDIKVSVVVPCYNVEKYVAQCVESICAQTLQEIEIICVNDGSKDGTLAILQDFAAKDDRVRIIDKPNSGYGQSVNMGMASAKGKYIGIVESDDFIESTMFEKLYTKAIEHDLDLARCNFFEYKTNGNVNSKRDFDFVKKNVVFYPLKEDHSPFYMQPSVWCNIYKRSWIEKNNIRFLETPGASYQDLAFSFKIYCLATRFMMIEDHLLHYRVDNENSSVNNPGKVFCVCDEYQEIKDFLEKNPSIKNIINYIVPVIKLSNYRWNYNRLSRKLQYQFVKKWSDELREHQKLDEIRWECFSRKDRKLLKRIMSMPILFKFFYKHI